MSSPILLLAMALSVPAAAPYTGAAAELEQRLAAMRKAGEPTTLAELAKLYPEPPKGRNAAVVLERAFQLMSQADRSDRPPMRHLPIEGIARLPALADGLPRPMRQAIRVHLNEHAGAYSLLHQAAAIDGCKFDLDFARAAPDKLLPRLARLRSATRFLALEAIENAEAGADDGGAEALVAALRLGSALRNEPVPISGLLRIACDAITIIAMERWASRAAPSPKALRRVEAALRAEADPKFLHPLLLGERCLAIHTFQTHLAKLQGDGPFRALGCAGGVARLDRLIPPDRIKLEMLVCLDLMAEALAAAGKPYPESFRRGVRLALPFRARIPKRCVLAGEVLPGLQRLFREAQAHMARLESARAALAVLRYRDKHGKLPAGLRALVPRFLDVVPPDPFDGQPLRYRKAAHGFTVYAIGRNGRDDGGRIGPAAARTPDVGFRVRWPKAGQRRPEGP